MAKDVLFSWMLKEVSLYTFENSFIVLLTQSILELVPQAYNLQLLNNLYTSIARLWTSI